MLFLASWTIQRSLSAQFEADSMSEAIAKAQSNIDWQSDSYGELEGEKSDSDCEYPESLQVACVDSKGEFQEWKAPKMDPKADWIPFENRDRPGPPVSGFVGTDSLPGEAPHEYFLIGPVRDASRSDTWDLCYLDERRARFVLPAGADPRGLGSTYLAQLEGAI